MNEFLTVMLDIETVADAEAVAREAERMPPPTAPSNYKDPAKIRSYITAEWRRRKESLEDGAALDWRTCQIVACGMNDDVVAGRHERGILESVSKMLAKAERLVTWNGYDFDLKILRNRMLVHRIKAPPCLQKIKRYDDTHHVDCRMVLCNWDSRAHGTLGDVYHALFSKEMDQPVSPNGSRITGRDVAALYAEGEIDLIAMHCLADCKATGEIYELLRAAQLC